MAMAQRGMTEEEKEVGQMFLSRGGRSNEEIKRYYRILVFYEKHTFTSLVEFQLYFSV